jgi:hypothetical protein
VNATRKLKMSDAADLAYVDAVLSGAVHTIPTRGGTGRRRRGKSSNWPPPQEVQSHEHHNAGSSAHCATSDAQLAAAPSDAADQAEGSVYSRPSWLSTSRVLHCCSCDVYVPHLPGVWETHIAGIRHRRQVLSLREYGAHGHLVQSVFESAPHEQPLHRLAGKAGSQFAGVQRVGGAAVAASPQARAAAQRLRTAALAQLLNMFGTDGHVYSSAGALFNAAALAKVHTESVPRPRSHALLAAHRVPGTKSPHPYHLQLAVDSEMVSDGAVEPLRSIRLHLLNDQNAGKMAACFVGVQLVLGALGGRARPLPRLSLYTCDVPWPMDRGLRAQGWRHVLASLRSLLESSAVLHLSVRRATLHRPNMPALPGELRSNPVSPDQAAVLRAAARAGARARRDDLMARVLHPRCGRCSLLQLLPAPLLLAVIDAGCPLDDTFVYVDEAVQSRQHSQPLDPRLWPPGPAV